MVPLAVEARRVNRVSRSGTSALTRLLSLLSLGALILNGKWRVLYLAAGHCASRSRMMKR